MTALHRWFREYPVLSAALVGVVAGPPIAASYTYVTVWWITRSDHPMLLVVGPSYLSVLEGGAVVGLSLGIVGGYLYKHFAKKI